MRSRPSDRIGFLLAPNTVPGTVLLSSTPPTLTKRSSSEYLPLDFSGCSLQKVSCRQLIRRIQHLQFVDHILYLVCPSYGSAFVNLVDVPVFPAKTRTHACWEECGLTSWSEPFLKNFFMRLHFPLLPFLLLSIRLRYRRLRIISYFLWSLLVQVDP